MMTPTDRYHNDPQFKTLVDMLGAYIHQADFTPSEVRLAAMLACVNNEYYNVRRYVLAPYTPEIDDKLNELHQMIEDEREPRD